jgi:PHD/YefM family antitoxin component YafN of YafNO toxin-antitoxin module
MKRLPFSVARESLDQLVDWADREDGVLLSKDGQEPVAVVLTMDHYRSIMAFFELASNPDELKESFERYDRILKGNTEGVRPLKL